MRAIGDEAAVELFLIDGNVFGIQVSAWGELGIAAGRSGLKIQLNAAELRDLAGRMLAVAEAVGDAPKVVTPGLAVGHA